MHCLDFIPAIDYKKYLQDMGDTIKDFLWATDHVQPDDPRPTEDWIVEKLLMAVGTGHNYGTPGSMLDDIVGEWKGSMHELNPPEKGDVFVCTIQGIGVFPNHELSVLCVAPPDSKQIFYVWLRGPIVQFKGHDILATGRVLRMVIGAITDDHVILPAGVIVLELGRTRASDIELVQRFCLPRLSLMDEGGKVAAVTGRIVEISKKGFYVDDESIAQPVRVELSEKENDCFRILSVDDRVILWKPDVLNSRAMRFSDNTMVMRLPMISNDDACNVTVSGSVMSVAHSVSGDNWIDCRVRVLVDETDEQTIVFTNMPRNVRERFIVPLRMGHVVWLFHLRASSDGTLRFTSESKLFNMNMFKNFVDSMAARPLPITAICAYRSGAIRALIVGLSISVCTIHMDCQCVLSDDKVCSMCSTSIGTRGREVLLAEITLEDGGFEPLTVFGTSVASELTDYDATDWKCELDEVKERIIRSQIGREYVFLISRGRPREFGFDDDGADIWRVDGSWEARSETVRTVKAMVQLLNQPGKYVVGYTGSCQYHRPLPTSVTE